MLNIKTHNYNKMKTENKQKVINLAFEKELPQDNTYPDSFWAWGTVEILDSQADCVRVEGVSWERYHRPEDNVYLKVYPSHIKILANGEPAVIGIVREIVKTSKNVNGKDYPAIKFLIELAHGADGNLLPLAAIYKNLIFSDQNLVDSTSIGFFIKDGYEMSNGDDIIKSELYEISLTSIPANCQANIKKELSKLYNKKEIDETMPKPKEPEKGCGDKPIKKEIDIEQFINELKSKYETIIANQSTIDQKLNIIIELMPTEDYDEPLDPIEDEALKKLTERLKKTI
jgi:hypothetical protein